MELLEDFLSLGRGSVRAASQLLYYDLRNGVPITYIHSNRNETKKK